MTPRDRVLKAVAHQPTDFVPYHIELTGPAHERLTEHTGDPGYISKIGNHVCGTGHGSMDEIPERPGYWIDHFGVVWNRTVDKDIGVVDGYKLTRPDVRDLQMPETGRAEIRRRCEQLVSVQTDKCRVFYLGFSLFERAWTLRGMQNLLMDMVEHPNFVHELMERLCDYNLQVADVALEYPFDLFYFGDDWGQQRGLIMGPALWREFIKPYLARMYGRVRSRGIPVVQHSCGDISAILPDVIEIGLGVYQTFQPEIYDVREVKREYGRDLAFWGAVSTQTVLPFVTPDEVRQVAREMIETLGDGGGYIASPTHAIPGDVPPENIVALAETFQNQPRFP